jgi:antitoxin component of RelBE/YafQ-DinJ toxin-antitoxin module
MRVNVRLDGEMRAQLDEDARRLGVSVSDVVRMVLKTYLPEMRIRARVADAPAADQSGH